jgi:hypothetical protein
MSIDDFINSVAAKDFNSAENVFKELMQDRIQDALDQQKILVAGQVFGEEDDDIEDFEPEEDYDDEDESEELEVEDDYT